MTLLRDLSLILLAGEVFIMALVSLALLGGAVYGLWYLQRHENLPSWLRLAQAYLALGRAYVELAMQAVVRPILLLHSILATVRGWLGAIIKQGGGR
ncbi:MAG: hypothetical protein DRI80_09755 [Chloroflexota bacterium]|nr:MAG: hypothetical protein DRI80_09755 [Chloroflexota bacterium]